MDDFGKKRSINDNIGGLDKDSRKELFNKFVESGGQVVEDKKKPANVKFNREKQKELLKAQEQKKETLKKKYGNVSKETGSHSGKNGSVINKENPYEGVGTVGLYFASVFSRVRTFTGNFVSPVFLKTFKETAQNRFLDLNLVVTTIIHSHSMTKEGLKKELILKYPLYYELLLRLDKLYEDKVFIEINNKSGNDFRTRVKFKDIDSGIKALLKKLYTLSGYKNDCMEAIGTAFGLMQKFEKISKSAVNDNISRARNAINFLFGTFLDKLFLVFLNCIKSNISINNPVVAKILKLEEEDFVGYIVKRIKEELKKRQGDTEEVKSEDKPEDKEEEKQADDVPAELHDGMDLIRQIDFSKDKFSKDSAAFYFEKNDKIFHIYMILEEFEKQYSFVLTSNKIRYAVDYQHGGKLDPKAEFNEIYIQLNAVHDSIREYMNIIREAYDIENQAGVPMMQKHNQLHNLSIRQSKTNMNIRIKLTEVIKKLDRILTIIYDKADRVVQNSDEQLSFDNSLEGKKKMDGKKPVESIYLTREYIRALLFKLEKGDLGGAGIYVS